ncbi:hypothetical protein GCM10010467_17760 [Actinocorallia glomerata]|uniref:Uncharacterized protein n=3 Tax=Actinomycetota TaxID=201174 RepID=A0ABP6LXG9_9MICC|nr:hypothetical protein [Nesterenkonia sp. CL21]MDS2173944.1 hypothetical protein [Nesterenkonia sp. CL21]OSM44295.1 hypothetical protein BCY76_002880 [Nesterenkonia sp. PF2B19]
MLRATLILEVPRGLLIKQEEHHDNDVEGYTGQHLIRGEEGFTFTVDQYTYSQHEEHVDIRLSEPVDDEGLHRDPMQALPRHGWEHHLTWPTR